MQVAIKGCSLEATQYPHVTQCFVENLDIQPASSEILSGQCGLHPGDLFLTNISYKTRV